MLQIHPPKYVKQILITLQARGHLAYLVGGCVRDMLMGIPPQDWDICTSALPGDVMELFPGSLPTGLKHGTVTVYIGSKSAEVTTFRIDGKYTDHRRPESVTYVSDLISDLARRDFTMNAVALSADGLISDPFGGMSDIRDRIIRCVGVPKLRYTEDALRMFRALRFSARLGFTIEAETYAAIKECSQLAAAIAPERIRDELEKILLSDRCIALADLLSCGLLSAYTDGAESSIPCFEGLNGAPRKPLHRWVCFALLLKKHGFVSSAGSFLASLRLDGRTLRCCTQAEKMLEGPPPDTSLGWKRLLNAYGVDAVSCAVSAYDAVYGKDCEKPFKAVLKSGECFSLKHLAVSGDDLLALGLRGQELGQMLKFLLDYVMEYPDNNKKEILLSLVRASEET